MKNFDYAFRDPNLFETAITHKSFHHENSHVSVGHNERLEFLGDAVLDLALSDELMRAFPEMNEGDLSKFRASLVNETVLSEIAKECGLNECLRLGRGEKNSGGDEKPRLLASAYEAILGAVYLDGGYAAAHAIIKSHFAGRISEHEMDVHFKSDYKTRLQEKVQAQFRRTPVYELVNEVGPDHEKTFHVTVSVGGDTIAKGIGRSKKLAEQDAARIALEELK